MSETEKREIDQFERYEEKRDDLWDGLLRAYCAGFEQAVDTFNIDTDVPTDVSSLRENQFITESHYYFWDGRSLPLEFWLQEQFGVEFVAAEDDDE